MNLRPALDSDLTSDELRLAQTDSFRAILRDARSYVPELTQGLIARRMGITYTYLQMMLSGGAIPQTRAEQITVLLHEFAPGPLVRRSAALWKVLMKEKEEHRFQARLDRELNRTVRDIATVARVETPIPPSPIGDLGLTPTETIALSDRIQSSIKTLGRKLKRQELRELAAQTRDEMRQGDAGRGE